MKFILFYILIFFFQKLIFFPRLSISSLVDMNSDDKHGIGKVFCIVCHYLDLSEQYQCRKNRWGRGAIDPTPFPKILANKFTLF